MKYEHLILFSLVMAAAWFLFINLWPRIMLSVYKRAILVKGFGEGPIPINTLYTTPQKLFADPIAFSKSNSVTAGMNRDTLISIGWLDLGKGPQILHVPEMGSRYYSVQFTNPSKNTNFAYVGTRATGTQAGDHLISGPGWKGQVPSGVTQISSPNNSVLVIGRTFVESNSDLPAAHDLAKQIKLTPLGSWQPNQ